MDALDAIFTRRSTRKMRPEMPPKELVEKVIEAGRAAPSGGNNQTTHFIVITKKEVFADLAAIAEKAFAAMEVRPDTYRSLANAINASKRGGYIFHYHAPVLIVVANRKGRRWVPACSRVASTSRPLRYMKGAPSSETAPSRAARSCRRLTSPTP